MLLLYIVLQWKTVFVHPSHTSVYQRCVTRFRIALVQTNTHFEWCVVVFVFSVYFACDGACVQSIFPGVIPNDNRQVWVIHFAEHFTSVLKQRDAHHQQHSFNDIKNSTVFQKLNNHNSYTVAIFMVKVANIKQRPNIQLNKTTHTPKITTQCNSAVSTHKTGAI